ncbi:3,4-dihydroxy-2-butanone-4-phosphate synthase [Halobacterium sp. KA-4]|uniref:3,4-dihydroxy-2-butanone-4-phosphate synthase n=1 Tax=Halobacterium sp. KA-4 TaxID=2896367 RepID=UPI001E42164B|nr:3,4-dihydroxy-2-butanone-4-phosphate synthase [Halobacterium sp. KA-4]MCD2201698.1 3,4-dihydroxy-2-butanone-4-phosphate synthase [Halobacterium sp. KA-4]
MSETDSSAPRQSAAKRAVQSLQKGNPVLIHDFDEREDETDIIFPAEAVTPADVARLRNDAGGLICVAISHEIAETLELPFLADVISHPCAETQDLAYDDRSSFSLPINHRDTTTGIPDNERAYTIAELGNIVRNPNMEEFSSEFRSPGHVHLLKGARGGLDQRCGHTELSLCLAEKANWGPAVVVCEMLDDRTGEAATRQDAIKYARKNDLEFVEGREILRELL